MKSALSTLAISACGLIAMTAAASADKPAGLSSLQGAWVEQSESCSDIYQAGKRGMTFRKDVSVFSGAFIISGRRIRTPGATCSIHGVSNQGDRMILNLGCTTSITTSPIKAYFSTGDDGALYRYNAADEKTGSKYQLCKP